MAEMIAYCGLDCVQCPARSAYINDDDGLREKTAAEWSKMFQVEIKASDIDCNGCKSSGPHFGHCQVCKIRQCCTEKGYDNCAPCPDYACPDLAFVINAVPPAKAYLERLREEL